MRVTPVLGSFLFATVVTAGAARAQEVRTIEINPVSLTLRVGETRTILATPRDDRGNPLITTNLRWTSLSPQVLQISFDANTPNVVTVTAVSPGVAQIEAVSGNVTSQMVISVVAAQQTPPVLPDSVLPAETVNTTLPMIVRVEPQVFGAPPQCRVGGFIGTDMILTTYTAIRGADRISITLNSGQVIDNVMVATHDVDANLAILFARGASAGGLTTGADPAGTARAWALGQPSCSQTVPVPVRVGLVGTATTVDRDLNNGQVGSPIVDRTGNIIGLAMGDRDVTPISAVAAIINRARANAAAGTIASPGGVADRENHRYGSIVVNSDATGMRGRVTPMESWHWAELATDGAFPLTVNGAAGRYRVELMSAGQVRTTETFVITAGQTRQVAINLPVVAAPVTQPVGEAQVITPPSGGGGVSPALILLGLAAAGGAAVFILLPKDTGVDCGLEPNHPDCRVDGTGTITISVPIP